MSLRSSKGKPKIVLSWEACVLISGFYSFPSAVFLLEESALRSRMKGKTRRIECAVDSEKLEKIKQLLEAKSE